MSGYPKLPDQLQQQLQKIAPSEGLRIRYYPCVVTTRSGEVIDRVYVQEETSFWRVWGVFHKKYIGKRSVRVEDVVSLAESPCRLPGRFATELYRAGETGMGGHEFLVQFADGTTEFYTGGNAVDFIDYPPGKSPKDVAGVRNSRQEGARRRPQFFWCLHS